MSLFIESWKREPNMAAVRHAEKSSAGKKVHILSFVMKLFPRGVLLTAQKLYWNYCTYFKRKTGKALLKMCKRSSQRLIV